jgi:hypothetical protein
MSRKEMVEFLSKKGISASLRDNTERLQKKMERYRKIESSVELDRKVRKVFKRIDRRLSKGGRPSKWMSEIVESKSPFDSAVKYVQKKYHVVYF